MTINGSTIDRVDHVGIVAPEIDCLWESYEAMGFQLSSPSRHAGRRTPDGPREPWASGNRCAMFDKSYVELLGIVAPDGYRAHIDAALERGPGAHVVALSCRDAALAARRLTALGFEDVGLLELERDVTIDGTPHTARFRLVKLETTVMPEARVRIIEHRTPKLLWQPALLRHANTAHDIDAVIICVADVLEASLRYTQLCGSALPTWWGSGCCILRLRAGTIVLGTPDVLAECLPFDIPADPSVVAVTVRVRDRSAAKRFLDARQVPVVDAGDTLFISPTVAGGTWLGLREQRWSFTIRSATR